MDQTYESQSSRKSGVKYLTERIDLNLEHFRKLLGESADVSNPDDYNCRLTGSQVIRGGRIHRDNAYLILK